MATFNEMATADYQARLAADAAAEQSKRDALLLRAQQAALPLFTDITGKIVLDPTKDTVADVVSMSNGLVILHANDASAPMIHIAIYPDAQPVGRYLVQQDASGEWVRIGYVSDLDDIGRYLVTGALT